MKLLVCYCLQEQADFILALANGIQNVLPYSSTFEETRTSMRIFKKSREPIDKENG